MSAFDDLVTDVEEQPTVTVPVKILLDPDASAKHQQLEQELADMLNRPGGDISERGPAQIADDLRDLMDGAKYRTFVFATVGAKKWSDLIAKHPPSDAQRKRGLDVAPTFWPEAMAAACTEPEGATLKGFQALWDKLSSGQWDRLIGGCRQANAEDMDIRPSQAASVLIRGQRPKSESPSI